MEDIKCGGNPGPRTCTIAAGALFSKASPCRTVCIISIPILSFLQNARINKSTFFRELNFRLVFSGCFVSLGALGFGFDNTWGGGALGLSPFGRKYGVFDPAINNYVIPSDKQSAGTGTGSAGIILGCLIAPWLCQHLGRKSTLLVMAGLLTVGVVSEASAAASFWQLIVERIIVYAGIGLASNVVPMYQSEVASGRIRGMLLFMINYVIYCGMEW